MLSEDKCSSDITIKATVKKGFKGYKQDKNEKVRAPGPAEKT